MTTTTNPNAATLQNLYNYADGEIIRYATVAEVAASDAAAEIDGGIGAITVDGITCYTAP